MNEGMFLLSFSSCLLCCAVSFFFYSVSGEYVGRESSGDIFFSLIFFFSVMDNV